MNNQLGDAVDFYNDILDQYAIDGGGYPDTCAQTPCGQYVAIADVRSWGKGPELSFISAPEFTEHYRRALVYQDLTGCEPSEAWEETYPAEEEQL